MVHRLDWRHDDSDPLPSLAQTDGFVADYESTRGALFDRDERKVLVAGQLGVASYGDRCQHSDDVLGLFPDVDRSRGWPRLLRSAIRPVPRGPCPDRRPPPRTRPDGSWSGEHVGQLAGGAS